MIQVTLYSREDCHLCHQVHADLDALQVEYPHELTEIDVDTAPALQRQYGFEVPVVTIGALIKSANHAGRAAPGLSRDRCRETRQHTWGAAYVPWRSSSPKMDALGQFFVLVQ